MTNTYTPPTREQIYAALFALFTPSGAPFKTVSRRLRSWQQVSSEEKPALYQLQTGEEPKSNESGVASIPYSWRLFVELYLFADQQDDQLPMSPILNTLVDAVVKTLEPSDLDEMQTLGGLVQNVRISGRIDYREGLMGPNAFAVVPIEIFTGALQPEY